jgi:hypothetical protein
MPFSPIAHDVDAAILAWLSRCEVATLQQLVYRYFVWHGWGASRGYKRVRQLLERGLVDVRPLRRHLGRASQDIVFPPTCETPSTAGPPRSAPPTWPDARLLEWLQLLEAGAVRQVQGWLPVNRYRHDRLLRAWAADGGRSPALARAADGAAALPLPSARLYGHVPTTDLRIVTRASTAADAARALQSLPDLTHVTRRRPLQIELVTYDAAARDAWACEVRRWCGQSGARLIPVLAARFDARPHPAERSALAEYRYDWAERHGVPHPVWTA